MLNISTVIVRPELGSVLIGFAIGEVITFVLFLAAVKHNIRAANIGSALTTTFLVPVMIIGVYAWVSEVTLKGRGTIFVLGPIAIGAQLTYRFFHSGYLGDMPFDTPS